MQRDMHYSGTYAMARATGIKRDASKVIAATAQFVDDNAEKNSVKFRDGARHAVNRKNIDLKDQRKIWVPFHFLPGNHGGAYTERLACRKDSDIPGRFSKTTFPYPIAPMPCLLWASPPMFAGIPYPIADFPASATRGTRS